MLRLLSALEKTLTDTVLAPAAVIDRGFARVESVHACPAKADGLRRAATLRRDNGLFELASIASEREVPWVERVRQQGWER